MDNFDLTDLPVEQIEPIKIPTPNDFAKKLVSRATAYTVSGVVVTLIHQNTTVASTRNKVQLYVGAYILGAMVADKAAAYVIDEYGEAIDSVVNWLWVEVEPEPSTPIEKSEPVKDIPTEQ